MQRHLRGEKEKFGCLGGHKYFYLDWNLDLYRCHFWEKPMCKVWDWDESKLIRDGCTRCMIDCYRDPSVLQFVAISASDAWQQFEKGQIALRREKYFRLAQSDLAQGRLGRPQVDWRRLARRKFPLVIRLFRDSFVPLFMKTDIHPKYVDAEIRCACGNVIKTRSTKPTIIVGICNVCHPFYTGQQKFVDTAGRVDKFQQRLAKTQAAQAALPRKKKKKV